MKVYIKNQQRLIKVNPQRIRKYIGKALQFLGLQKAELSILLVNDRRMKILNYQYRGVNRTTDVLSFPQVELRVKSLEFGVKKKLQVTKLKSRTKNSGLKTPNFILGDIVISMPLAQRQAAEHGLTLDEELRWLLIHGLLHLIGYDHEKSRYHKNKMRLKERGMLDALTMEKPLMTSDL
ncbi:MAG: rRNA maturation RNase YbeY [Nitrospirae bacterium]|nr:rRNA maturation RNase YbeY [Nitrospirota bacterium]